MKIINLPLKISEIKYVQDYECQLEIKKEISLGQMRHYMKNQLIQNTIGTIIYALNLNSKIIVSKQNQAINKIKEKQSFKYQ
ncbi:unnamed protein product [Paramecium sonneborni]|uniref:Uncharacterized protein n=1 Tax=Paramecium sonneborni TaxID=65129 RepID=A0A8S1RMW0_9CILI|nr:unnamed protein product [Paramecium sonneborni]